MQNGPMLRGKKVSDIRLKMGGEKLFSGFCLVGPLIILHQEVDYGF
jgi:hypothetical protein